MTSGLPNRCNMRFPPMHTRKATGQLSQGFRNMVNSFNRPFISPVSTNSIWRFRRRFPSLEKTIGACDKDQSFNFFGVPRREVRGDNTTIGDADHIRSPTEVSIDNVRNVIRQPLDPSTVTVTGLGS